MISNQYLRMMSRYNRWQNQWMFHAADQLSANERQMDRAGFWGSIESTLSHIYWGDRMWFSRFDLVDAPDVAIGDSSKFVSNWSDLTEKREHLDKLVIKWSDDFEEGPILGSLEWFSGAANKDVKAPLSMVLPHIFNHQTHHRGQVHAMLTAAGATTQDTDLFMMPEEFAFE